MKKQNWKKVISLIAGSLVIALVVSILPGGFLVNAAEVSERQAKKIALEELKLDRDDVEEFIVEKITPADDVPYYKVTVKTNDGDYKVKVLAETQEVEFEDKAKELAIAEVLKKIDKNEDEVTIDRKSVV